MPRKALAPSLAEITAQFVEDLRRSTIRPSIFGYRPMEHQVKFHSSHAKGRAFMGGNRSGKTVGGATEAAWWLGGNHAYIRTPEAPIRLRGVASDWPNGMEKILLPELAKWIPPSNLINGSWEDSFSKGLRLLTCANGSTMDFTTCEMDLVKHAGTSRHAIWFDEEPPKAIFNENMARLIDTGGKWWLTMTPIEGMTWVYDDIYMKSRTTDEIFVVEVQMDDNIYLSTPEIEVLMSTFDDDEKEARRRGKFVALGGLIYKQFGPSNFINPISIGSEEYRSMLKHWTFFNMMDHGFNNPTAWLWGATDKDGRVIIFDEHYANHMVVAEHAEIVKETNRKWGITPSYSVGDPSIANSDPLTGTSVQIEYAIKGVPIVLGNNNVKIGLDTVATAFKDHQLFIAKNCEKTIWELARYRWATWASKVVAEKKNVREEPNKKDDHACDALRYGLASRPEHLEKVLKKVESLAGLAPSLPTDGTRRSDVVERDNPYDPMMGVEN